MFIFTHPVSLLVDLLLYRDLLHFMTKPLAFNVTAPAERGRDVSYRNKLFQNPFLYLYMASKIEYLENEYLSLPCLMTCVIRIRQGLVNLVDNVTE